MEKENKKMQDFKSIYLKNRNQKTKEYKPKTKKNIWKF